MKYLPLFLLIQAVNILLVPLGWVICLWPAAAKRSWLWWNSIDPPQGSWWQKYVWLAWRNPVSNLRLIPGVSGAGRPLWYITWTMFGKQFYAKAGWTSNTYPVLSAGGGRGW